MEFKADFELYPTGGTKLDCKNPLWSFSWRLGAEMNTFQFWPKVRNYIANVNKGTKLPCWVRNYRAEVRNYRADVNGILEPAM